MKLPMLRRLRQRDHLVYAWSEGVFAYVQARKERNDLFRVQRFGVIRQTPDGADDFSRKLTSLGWRGRGRAREAVAMLRPAQYQLLQIDVPAVPPEELRTAARWQIRDMVSQHVDDLTLDVLRVGDDQGRTSGGLFVVAAPNAEIRAVMDMAQKLHCEVKVIDIRDLAQRNLQTALARRLGVLARAQAAIGIIRGNQALLTICANGELFYSRRIELGEDFLGADWRQGAAANGELTLSTGDLEADRGQRLVVEVQRSLDLWDRTWPQLPLDRVMVQAGARSEELANWLGQELGHTVLPMDVSPIFPGFEGGSDEDRRLCWPLLGVLLREEGREP